MIDRPTGFASHPRDRELVAYAKTRPATMGGLAQAGEAGKPCIGWGQSADDSRSLFETKPEGRGSQAPGGSSAGTGSAEPAARHFIRIGRIRPARAMAHTIRHQRLQGVSGLRRCLPGGLHSPRQRGATAKGTSFLLDRLRHLHRLRHLPAGLPVERAILG